MLPWSSINYSALGIVLELTSPLFQCRGDCPPVMLNEAHGLWISSKQPYSESIEPPYLGYFLVSIVDLDKFHLVSFLRCIELPVELLFALASNLFAM